MRAVGFDRTAKSSNPLLMVDVRTFNDNDCKDIKAINTTKDKLINIMAMLNGKDYKCGGFCSGYGIKRVSFIKDCNDYEIEVVCSWFGDDITDIYYNDDSFHYARC